MFVDYAYKIFAKSRNEEILAEMLFSKNGEKFVIDEKGNQADPGDYIKGNNLVNKSFLGGSK